jgi:hypothetical protein
LLKRREMEVGEQGARRVGHGKGAGQGGLGVGVAGDGRDEVRPDGELGRRSSGDGVGAVYGVFASEESERERGRVQGEGDGGFYREMRGEGRGTGEEEETTGISAIDGHYGGGFLMDGEEEVGEREGETGEKKGAVSGVG